MYDVHSGRRDHPYLVALEVVRVLKTQIVTQDGRRWNRTSGRLVCNGDVRYRSYIVLFDKAAFDASNNRRRRDDLAARVQSWLPELDVDTLSAMIDLAKAARKKKLDDEAAQAKRLEEEGK